MATAQSPPTAVRSRYVSVITPSPPVAAAPSGRRPPTAGRGPLRATPRWWRASSRDALVVSLLRTRREPRRARAVPGGRRRRADHPRAVPPPRPGPARARRVPVRVARPVGGGPASPAPRRAAGPPAARGAVRLLTPAASSPAPGGNRFDDQLGKRPSRPRATRFASLAQLPRSPRVTWTVRLVPSVESRPVRAGRR